MDVNLGVDISLTMIIDIKYNFFSGMCIQGERGIFEAYGQIYSQLSSNDECVERPRLE